MQKCSCVKEPTARECIPFTHAISRALDIAISFIVFVGAVVNTITYEIRVHTQTRKVASVESGTGQVVCRNILVFPEFTVQLKVVEKKGRYVVAVTALKHPLRAVLISANKPRHPESIKGHNGRVIRHQLSFTEESARRTAFNIYGVLIRDATDSCAHGRTSRTRRAVHLVRPVEAVQHPVTALGPADQLPLVAREGGGAQRSKLHAPAPAPAPAEHFVTSVSAVAKSVADQGVVDGRTVAAWKQREVVRRLPAEIATRINPRGALVKDLNQGPVRTFPGRDPLQPTTGPREAHSQGGRVGCGDAGVGPHADIAIGPVVG